MDNKVVFIPGWMKSVGFYGAERGIDIWIKDGKAEQIKSASVIVAHSFGCPFALDVWKQNQEAKVILLNPLVPKRSILFWFWRWMQFAAAGGAQHDANVPRSALVRSIAGAIRWSQYDLVKELMNIPKKKAVVIRGKNDRFFCDQDAMQVLNKCEVQIEEVDELGHEWNEKYKEIIVKHI